MNVAFRPPRSGDKAPPAADPPERVPDPLALPRAPRRIWCLAALGAVLIHAGCAALAVEYLAPEDDAAEDQGARAIEVGLDLLAPRRDDSQLPAGPDSEASVASAAVPEHKTAVDDTDLPKAVPTETDDPDRAVTPDDTRTKPEDQKTTTARVETPPSDAASAAQATAMPSPETAAVAPRSVAPAPGNAESLRRVVTTWQKELVAHVDKYLRYPDNREGRNAETLVTIVLDRTGRVVSATVARSSGDRAFDDAALAMMRRADPVPAPPPAVADGPLSFTLPVDFHRNHK